MACWLRIPAVFSSIPPGCNYLAMIAFTSNQKSYRLSDGREHDEFIPFDTEKKQHHTDVFRFYSGPSESARIPTGTWAVDKIPERSGDFTGKLRREAVHVRYPCGKTRRPLTLKLFIDTNVILDVLAGRSLFFALPLPS